MKKFIRYLYEYQNGRRVQNTGFVKVNESEDSAEILIYGKRFPAAGNRVLEIFVFYMMGNQPVGISMGTVTGNQPMFGYRLEFTVEDVGGMDIFRHIEGIILVSCPADQKESMGAVPIRDSMCRWYGAVWNERPVNIEQMMRREEILRREEPGNEEAQRENPEDGGLEERENRNNQTVSKPESAPRPAPESAPRPTPMPLPCPPLATPERPVAEPEPLPEPEPQMQPTPLPHPVPEPIPESIPECTDEREIPKLPQKQMPESMRERCHSQSPAPPERDVIYKITRQDMAKLPRREWKLANNQFLLHGCHNYHHLVSFEKDGKCWLGVPGIYHPREQQAALAFGFDQFMTPDEGEIELSEDERNDQDHFGYWCREVSSVIAD